MLNVPRQVLQVCEGRGVISRERGGKGEGAVNMNNMKYLDLYNPSIGKGAS